MSVKSWKTWELLCLGISAGIGLEYKAVGWDYTGPLPAVAAVLLLLAPFAATPALLGGAVLVATKTWKYGILQLPTTSQQDVLPVTLLICLLGARTIPWLLRRTRPFGEEEQRDVLFLVMGAYYLEAAAYKFVHYDLWFNGNLVSDLLFYQPIYVGGTLKGDLTLKLLGLLISWLTLAFETGFLFTTWWPRWRITFAASGIAFHGTIWFLLNVNFYQYQIPVLAAMLLAELSARRKSSPPGGGGGAAEPVGAIR